MDVDALFGLNDMMLRILVGVGLVLFGMGLWALLQRREFSKECPRCHRRMPRTASRCGHCGWRGGTRSTDTSKPWL